MTTGESLRHRAGNTVGSCLINGLPGFCTALELVAEEERFAFSYNITSLTAAIRRAFYRERTNVGRTAYSDRVKSMLLASQSEQVAELLAADLSSIGEGAQHDEVAWTEVAVHACRFSTLAKRCCL